MPYLMSSHPGSRLDDAIELACFLKKNHIRPEQVQDFYPTPGTISTCMFYTELDPYTMEPVYVAKTPTTRRFSGHCFSIIILRTTPFVLRHCVEPIVRI